MAALSSGVFSPIGKEWRPSLAVGILEKNDLGEKKNKTVKKKNLSGH